MTRPRPPDAVLRAADALGALAQSLPVPAGHRAQFEREAEVSWFGAGGLPSMSLYVRRIVADDTDFGQVCAEVRLHLNKDGEPRSCTLFCHRGPNIVGRNIDLLSGPSERFFYGKDVHEILAVVGPVLSNAMSRPGWTAGSPCTISAGNSSHGPGQTG